MPQPRLKEFRWLWLILLLPGGCSAVFGWGGSDLVNVKAPHMIERGMETRVLVEVRYVHGGDNPRLSDAVCHYRLYGHGDFQTLALHQVKQTWQHEVWAFTFPAFTEGKFVEYFLEFKLSDTPSRDPPMVIPLIGGEIPTTQR